MPDYNPITLADAFIQAGELDDALDALNQHLEANPSDDDARRVKIQVLMRMNSKECLEAAIENIDLLMNHTADDYLQQSVIFEKLGESAHSVAATLHAWILRPNDVNIWERNIRQIWNENDADEMEFFLARLPQKWQDSWRWLCWHAEAALLKEDFNKAAKHFSEALIHLNTSTNVHDPFVQNSKAQILLKRADAYHRLQSLPDAAADYAAAEQIIPNDPMIPFNRGLIALLQGDPQRGIELCQHAYISAPAALRDEMHKALAEDERYAPISAALGV
jgi:tetratricopeptide (TPR) repeat protein